MTQLVGGKQGSQPDLNTQKHNPTTRRGFLIPALPLLSPSLWEERRKTTATSVHCCHGDQAANHKSVQGQHEVFYYWRGKAGHRRLHTQRGEEANLSFGGKVVEVLARWGEDGSGRGWRPCTLRTDPAENKLVLTSQRGV